MAQSKDKRIVTESSAEATFEKAGAYKTDDRVSEISGVAGTKIRLGLDEAYLPKNEFAGLIRWHAAYAARYQKQARVAVIADNEGIGVPAPHHRNRWQRLLELSLRDVPGGAGFIPALYTSPLLTDPTTRSGGNADEVLAGYLGPAGKYLNLSNGGTATWLAETMTSFRLWFSKPDFFSGPGTVKVDGNSVGTITSSNGGNGSVDAQTFPALPAAPQAVTSGSRVISVTGTDGNPVTIGALECFNGDENSGVHFYDFSRHTLTYLDTKDPSWDAPFWNGWIKNVDPHLIIFMMGNPSYGQDPDFTTFGIADTMGKVDNMINASTSSILLVLPPRPIKQTNVNPSEWTNYALRLRHEAALRPDRVAFLDLQEQWPILKAGGSTSLGLMNETDYPTYPSVSGHRRIADILKKVLV